MSIKEIGQITLLVVLPIVVGCIGAYYINKLVVCMISKGWLVK